MLCTEYETDEASLTVRKDRTFSGNPNFQRRQSRVNKKNHGVKKKQSASLWQRKLLRKNLLETLLISQPDNGEQALEIADNLIRSGAIDIIVIDSVAALTPKAEIEREMGDNKVGLQARLMSQALRKLTAVFSQ